MEDKKFDKIIENMIDEYEVKYSHDSWRRLEQKLNYEEKEDALFDRVIANKLNTFSIPVTSGSFARFEKKTKQHSYNIYSKLNYIAAIAAVFLLIILTISYNTFLGKKKSVEVVSNKIQNKSTNGTSGTALKFKDHKNNIAEISVNAINNDKGSIVMNNSWEKTEKDLNLTIQVNTFSEFGIKYSFQFFKPDLNNSNSCYKENNGLTIYFPSIYKSYSGFDMIMAPFNIRDSKKNDATYFNSTNPGLIYGNDFVKLSDEIIYYEDKPTSNSSVQPEIAENNESENSGDKRQLLTEDITGKKGKLNVQLFGSPVLNFINTPNDLVLRVPGYNNNSPGYNFGFGISKENGNHEFGLGIEYQNFTYSPKKVVAAQGDKSYWLDKISAGKIGIPFFYKYHFKQGKKTGLFASAGICPLITTNSSYEFIETETGSGNLIKLANELLESNDFRQTLYAAKTYEKGLLEGGNTSGNLSLSLNFGLGIETQISPSVSFFFEPEISTLVINSSFGPNNDRITSLNFKIGFNNSFNL